MRSNKSTACVCVDVDVVVRWWGGSRVSKAFLPPELLPLVIPSLSRLANSRHASFPLASSGPLWLAQREEPAYGWAVTGRSWPSVPHNPAPNKCCSAPGWRSEERRAPLLDTRCNYQSRRVKPKSSENKWNFQWIISNLELQLKQEGKLKKIQVKIKRRKKRAWVCSF